MGSTSIDSHTLPDLLQGLPSSSLPADGTVAGRVGEEALLLLRTEEGVHAVQATCPAGAAVTAAALALWEAGHRGELILIDPDPAAPYDRPNLSKDDLAGTAPEEWLPLRTTADWDALHIERDRAAGRIVRAVSGTVRSEADTPRESRDEPDPVVEALPALLACIGAPARETQAVDVRGAAETFRRLTSGYGTDPRDLIGDAGFAEARGEAVVVRDIPFTSLCRHELVPFGGRAHVAYLLGPLVVGFPKLAGLVELVAHRLQSRRVSPPT